jgi:DNA-directed RNA polymerase specialized sigma subunit
MITDAIHNFDDLQNRCWGQAISVLDEIYNADKEEDLMRHLEDVFGMDEPTITEINDYLAYDWEEIYQAIGMEENDDD